MNKQERQRLNDSRYYDRAYKVATTSSILTGALAVLALCGLEKQDAGSPNLAVVLMILSVALHFYGAYANDRRLDF